MARSITIKISQSVINEATTKNSAKCMIAQALRMIGASSTNVTAESATFNLGDTRYTYPLPAKAAVELMKFDKNKKDVQPFQFTLDGRMGYERPVIKRGPIKKSPKKAKVAVEGKPTVRRSERRFHGLRVIEVSA